MRKKSSQFELVEIYSFRFQQRNGRNGRSDFFYVSDLRPGRRAVAVERDVFFHPAAGEGDQAAGVFGAICKCDLYSVLSCVSTRRHTAFKEPEKEIRLGKGESKLNDSSGWQGPIPCALPDTLPCALPDTLELDIFDWDSWIVHWPRLRHTQPHWHYCQWTRMVRHWHGATHGGQHSAGFRQFSSWGPACAGKAQTAARMRLGRCTRDQSGRERPCPWHSDYQQSPSQGRITCTGIWNLALGPALRRARARARAGRRRRRRDT